MYEHGPSFSLTGGTFKGASQDVAGQGAFDIVNGFLTNLGAYKADAQIDVLENGLQQDFLVATIPEPETWMLFGLGLGVVGLISAATGPDCAARRRALGRRCRLPRTARSAVKPRCNSSQRHFETARYGRVTADSALHGNALRHLQRDRALRIGADLADPVAAVLDRALVELAGRLARADGPEDHLAVRLQGPVAVARPAATWPLQRSPCQAPPMQSTV